MRHDKRPGEPSDRVRDQHMVIAAREALLFVKGKAFTDPHHDRMLARALVHAVMEIGEAARNVSDAGRARAPTVEWSQAVKMRNFLTHVYWGINLELLWQTVERDPPPLIAAVESALAGWPADPEP